MLKTIGTLIASKRIEAGLKQYNLAHVCHINASSLSRLERGHREINLRNLYYIIYNLNMDMDVFFAEVCRLKRAFRKIEKH